MGKFCSTNKKEQKINQILHQLFEIQYYYLKRNICTSNDK